MAVLLPELEHHERDGLAVVADGLRGVSEIFGTDLPANAAFRQAVVGHLGSLFAVGALATVAKLA